MNISTRRVPLSWIGDVIEYSMVAAACLLFYSMTFLLAISTGPLSSIRLLIPLLLIFSIVMVCKTLFHQAQCSGFGFPRAFGLALMQMTAILVPLTQALGVKKGLAARCDKCHKKKFIWHPICPRCGNPGPGSVSNKRLASAVQGKPPQTHWWPRVAMRVIIPLELFVLGGSMGSVSGHPFISNRVSLVFGQGATQQDKERAIELVRDWIEANSALEDSHLGAAHATNITEGLPERYRINVTAFSTDRLRLEGLGLRWDPTVVLSEKIAQHLAETLAGVCPVRLVFPEKTRKARSPAFQTRGYLDNRIHWKVPRK